MAFRHYLRYDGVPFIDTDRTAKYADALGLGFFKCDDICGALSAALYEVGLKRREHTDPGHQPYPPWHDSDIPASARFAGIHVLDVVNLDSSTWNARSQEGLLDGGYVTQGRFTTREMTFRVLLLGTDMVALRYGFNWLSSLLRLGKACLDEGERPFYHTYNDLRPGPNKPWWTLYKDADIPSDLDVYQAPLVDGFPQTYDGFRQSLSKRIPLTGLLQALVYDEPCKGNRLEFYTACPVVEEPWEDQYRYMVDVHCTEGPAITSIHELSESCGGGAWCEVEFTLTAANPFAYRLPIVAAQETGSFSSYADYMSWAVYKNPAPVTDDNVYEAPLMFRDVPHTYRGVNESLWRRTAPVEPNLPASNPVDAPPVLWMDPDCPPLARFPSIPSDELLCAPQHQGPWNRITYKAGSRTLPRHVEAALVMDFTARTQDFESVRVRLTPEHGDPDQDFVVEFYLQWIAEDATLRIDGVQRLITMSLGNRSEPGYITGPASHLVVMDSTAAGYEYPTVVCGNVWTITVDVPALEDVSLLDVRVLLVGREN